MNTANRLFEVVVDRDSVCAGDDCVSHEARFDMPVSATVLELVLKAQHASPLAGIAGGNATWLIDTAGYGEGCIGVVAQQWLEPRFIVAESTTVESLYWNSPPTVFFRYWCQADPEAVFEALKAGAPLPSRY